MNNRRIVSHLITLLAVSALVVVLALLLRGRTPQMVANFDSPLPSPPPKAATATKVKTEPTPWPTLKPTSTRPPEPTLPPPTPKPTLAPPTPTPEPLPTLIPGRDTFVYSTTGDHGPEIWRVQPDEVDRITEWGLKTHTPDWWNSRVFVSRLYPSPNGDLIAIEWVYGEGGNNVSLLNVDEGYVKPLFDSTLISDGRVEFLDWASNEKEILVIGAVGNPELGGRVWVVNIDTNEIKPTNIVQDRDAREITSLSHVPSGPYIVYAKSECYQCGSEIWKINLAQEEPHHLLTKSEHRVENIEISPDGRHIAFTVWHESTDYQGTGVTGELWLMEIDGKNPRLLSPIITGYLHHYGPVWSSNGESLAFIISDPDTSYASQKLTGDVALVDIVTGEVKTLTHTQNSIISQPFWSPDGTKLIFAVLEKETNLLVPWVIEASGRDFHRIGEQANLKLGGSASQPSIIWLSPPISGEK